MELNYEISVTSEYFVCKAPVSFEKYYASANYQLVITSCLCLRKLFPLNSTFSITNFCIA